MKKMKAASAAKSENNETKNMAAASGVNGNVSGKAPGMARKRADGVSMASRAK